MQFSEKEKERKQSNAINRQGGLPTIVQKAALPLWTNVFSNGHKTCIRLFFLAELALVSIPPPARPPGLVVNKHKISLACIVTFVGLIQ